MNRITRRAIGGAIALTLGTAYGATLGGGPAGAEPLPDCKTVTTNIVDRPDNGHGTGNPGAGLTGYWADVTGTRTVKVCVVVPQVAALVAVDGATYTATVVDSGTLVTRGGDMLSPNKGVKLLAGLKGTWNGGFEATYTAPAPTSPGVWPNWTPENIPATVTGDPRTSDVDSNPTNGSWLQALYTGTKLISDNLTSAYSWTYTTCNEQWIDAEDNKDGQGEGAGDITGLSANAGRCLDVDVIVRCDGKVDIKITNHLIAGVKVRINGVDKILTYGLNVFPGVTTTDGWVRVKFGDKVIKELRCIKPPNCPTPTPTPTATASPTPTASTSPTASASPSTIVIVPINNTGGSRLAQTGSPIKTIVGGGVLLLLGGAVLLVLGLRRNRRAALSAE
jgi:hypothetical protein